MDALHYSWSDSFLQRHFIFPQSYKVFNIFICSSVKPSVAVTGQNVDDKNKRMFMERFHEMLTRKICATLWCLVEIDQGNLEGMTPSTGISKLAFINYMCSVLSVL